MTFLFPILLSIGSLTADSPAFEEGAFYRFNLGGSTGVLVSLAVKRDFLYKFSVFLPRVVLNRVNPDALNDLSVNCDDVRLEWSVNADSGRFVAHVPFESDPCLRQIRDVVPVVPAVAPLTYDAKVDAFAMEIIITADLERCNPDDPLEDDDDEEDYDDDEFERMPTARAAVTALDGTTDESAEAQIEGGAARITSDSVLRLTAEFLARLRSNEDEPEI